MDTMINFSAIKNAYSYTDYKKLVISYAEKGGTSGNEQLPERIEATKLNAQRIKRIDKQIELSNEIQETIAKIFEKWTWIVLVESWCGDGAQNLPVVAKIAECSPNIKLKILLRDENLGIMDAYLTNGSRSIPKLICINSTTNEEIGTWGSRPVKIQQMVKEYKAQNPQSSHDDFVKSLHLWYAKDKGESLQKDFEKLLNQWAIV
jgi:hypothetical protein